MGKRILTNKHNLPETLVKAVQYDTHKLAGTLSVTTLIDGPQIRYLKKLHDYESDVVDNIYALMGTALHHILERANIESVRKQAFILTAETIMMEADKLKSAAPEKAQALQNGANWIFKLIPVFFPEIAERYIFEKTMVLNFGDHTLSGTFDLYDKQTGILWDYKFCSTHSYTHPESRKKWEEQTNIYAHMLRSQGIPVNGIRIVAFFRDWNAFGMMKNSNYPNMQIKEIFIPLYTPENAEELINYHLNLHRMADAGNVPECSGEVRWATGDIFAVKPQGSNRALSKGLFDSRPAAEAFLSENKHKHTAELYIETRAGESRRCKSYCPVSAHCPQYKAELQRNALLN